MWAELFDAAAAWRAGAGAPTRVVASSLDQLVVPPGAMAPAFEAINRDDPVAFTVALWAARLLVHLGADAVVAEDDDLVATAAGAALVRLRSFVLLPTPAPDEGALPELLGTTLPSSGWTLRMMAPVPEQWSREEVAAVLTAWQARVRRGLASRSGVYDDGSLRFEVSLSQDRDREGLPPRMRVGALGAREVVERLERELATPDAPTRVAVVWQVRGAELPRAFWQQLWLGREIAAESWRDGARHGRRSRFGSAPAGLFGAGWLGVWALSEGDRPASVRATWTPNPWAGAPVLPGAPAVVSPTKDGVILDFPSEAAQWAPDAPADPLAPTAS